MSRLRRAIQSVLASHGYEIKRISGPNVEYANFLNLCRVVELGFQDQDNRLPPNDRRLELLARLVGTPPSEAYFIIQALHQSMHLAGDVCEFGVARGSTSALIANEIAPVAGKRFHLFDSFAGLSAPTHKDVLKDDIFSLGEMRAYAGKMAYPEAMVRAQLEAITFPPERYAIHKGFIQEVLRGDTDLPKQVSFAYVDFDLYEPTRATLAFLHEVTEPGSVVIVDDYDFFSTGVKSAVKEFLAEWDSNGQIYSCLVPHTEYGYFAVLTRRG
jgi:O-methyltransferase